MSNKNEVIFHVKGLAELDISNIQKSLKNLQLSFGEGVSIPDSSRKNITQTFEKINTEIQNFISLQKSSTTSTKNYDNLLKSGEKINTLYDKLKTQFKDLGNLSDDEIKHLFPSEIIKKIQEAKTAMDQYADAIKQAENQAKIQQKTIEKLQKTLNQKQSQKEQIQSLDVVSTGELKNLKQQQKELSNLAVQIKSELNQKQQELNTYIQEKNIVAPNKSSVVKEYQAQINDLTTKYQNASQQAIEFEQKIANITSVESQTLKINKLNQEIDQLEQELNNANKSFSNIENIKTEIFNNLLNTLQKIIGIDLSNIPRDIESIDLVVNNLSNEQIEKIKKSFSDLNNEVESIEQPFQNFSNQLEVFSNANEKSKQLNQEITNLTDNFLYFFSLTNGWFLLKRAVTEAYNTIKELDASMTEIAVVSDYTLDEIWRMRSQYSSAATEMGAKTIDLIDATKLYVQQGLDLNEALEVGIETTKMARIANLDGAEATNLMTSALRGFNMEMSEANRVNDVYSELAAKSAADTYEIATAMSKTASIAYNAGASFENLSAFLTQIIETTREAPETAGTAMKTIIARFQELKKPLSEIEEVDGEIVDANKIEAALREAGVALRDTNGEFRNFDDVILELASKWDTLDKMTQRYIATQAAGSRQQSRFLALMEDNERLLELTGYASNSAGASQKQFNKTLDSLEAKINELNNALDIFWTNLANNDIIKNVITLLTSFLNVINSIVGVFSQSESGVLRFVGSIMQLLLLYTAFKGVKKIISSISTALKATSNEMNSTGQKAGINFWNGFKKSFTFSGVSKEIHAQLQEIFSNKQGFTRNSNKFNKTMTLTQLGKTFSGLDDKTIKKIMSPKVIESLGTDIYESIKFSKLDNALQEQVTKSFSNMVQNIQTGKTPVIQAFKQFNSELSSMNISTPRISIDTQRLLLAQTSISNIQKSITTTITVIGSLGAALSILSTIVGNNTDENNVFSKTLSNLGNVLLVITPLLSLLSVGIQRFGISAAAAGATAQAGFAAFLPILYAILAVILLITVVFSVVDSLIETNAEKLEKVNKSIEETTTEIEEATKAIEDLENQAEELKTLQSDLDKLTKGTAAWTQKLIEVNQQVLNLINEYPKLIDYLDRGADGQLTISDEGFDTLIKEQQQRLFTNQTAQQTLRLQKTSLDANTEINNYRKSVVEDGIDSVTDLGVIGETDDLFLYKFNPVFSIPSTGLTDNQYRDIAATMAKEGISVDDGAEVAKIFRENGGDGARQFSNFYNQIKELGDDFEEISLIALKTAEAMETQRDAIIDNTIANNEELKNLEYINQGAGIVDITYDDMDERISERQEELGGKINDDMKAQYSAITGLTIDEINAKIEDKSLSVDTITHTIASSEVTEEMTGDMKEINDLFKYTKEEYKEKDSFKAVKNLLTSEAQDITLTNLDALKESLKISNSEDIEKLTEGSINQMLGEVGLSLGDLGLTAEQFKEQLTLAEESFTNVDTNIEKYGTKFQKTFNKFTDNISQTIELTSGQYQQLSEIFMGVAQRGGNVEEFSNIISNLINANPERVSELLSLIGTIDFSNADSISSFINQLETLGIEIDDTIKNKLISSANAMSEINLTKLNESMSRLAGLIDIINAKIESGVNSFTKEEYEEAIAEDGLDKSDFVQSGPEEYIYTGDLSDKNDKLYQEAIAKQQEQTEILKKDIAMGENYSNYFEGHKEETAEVTIGDEKKNYTAEQLMDMIAKDKYVVDDDSKELLKAAAVELGIISSEEAEEITKELLTDRIKTDYNKYYVKLKENRADLEDIEGYINDLKMLNLDSSTDIAIAGGTEQQQIAKDIQDAESLGINIQELEEYRKVLGQVNDELTEAEKSRIALMNAKINLGLTKIIDSYDDWNKLINKNTGLIETNSLQDLAIFTELQNSMKIMLNLSENLSDAFWENSENITLIQQAAQGSIEALKQLQKAAMEDYVINILLNTKVFEESEKEAINELVDFINNYDFPDLKASAVLEDESFIANCNRLLRYSSLTQQEIANIFKYLGFDTKVVTKKQKIAVGSRMGPLNEKEIVYETIDVLSLESITSAGSFGGNINTIDSSGTNNSDDSSEPWENNYDWLYNLVNKTNNLLRQRNKLEWEYENILKKERLNLFESLNNKKDQLNIMKEQLKLYNQQLKNRLQEQQALEEEYSDVYKYAQYNEKIGYVEIDWSAIESLSGKEGNNETGERIDEYISKLEEISDQIDSIKDEQMGIEDAIYELQLDGQDDLSGLESDVIDALTQLRQDEIDKLTEINDTINDTNTSILDKLQTGIDDYRNQREQDEQLKDIQEMENRLSLMQTDTSGSNILDILQLQEQLQQSRQDYTDTLIDKSIEEMTKQNEEAYNQRNKQIEYLQMQLDHDIEIGKIAEEANLLITEAINQNPNKIIELLKNNQAFDGMATITKEQWESSLLQQIQKGFEYWILSNSLTGGTEASQSLLNELVGEQISFIDKKGKTLTGTIQSDGTVKVNNTYYSDVIRGTNGQWVQANTGTEQKKNSSTPNTSTSNITNNSDNKQIPVNDWGVTVVKGAKFKSGVGFNEEVRSRGFDKNHRGGFYVYQKNGDYYLIGNGKANKDPNWTGWVHKQYLIPYEKGGLADFTGPAWLDGNKSHPELILNAKDTENFIQLKDILSDVFNNNNNNKTGNNYYDIKIEVDQLSNDYDVEQLMNKMKRIIEQDAQYRNVTAIDLGRR